MSKDHVRTIASAEFEEIGRVDLKEIQSFRGLEVNREAGGPIMRTVYDSSYEVIKMAANGLFLSSLAFREKDAATLCFEASERVLRRRYDRLMEGRQARHNAAYVDNETFGAF